MTVICVDISSYQKGFSFAQFKAGGGLGVILKATEGTTVKDSCYATFRKEALAAGLAVASYHFFSSASDPAAQASFYLGVAAPLSGDRVVCDWENDSGPEAVAEFLQAIRLHRPDLQLTVYSGNVAKEKLGSTRHDWLAENTSLWLAQYSAPPPIWPTATWPTWSLWQYSGSGHAPGFAGQVDLNEFNGSNEAFLAWMGPTVAAAPAPRLPIVTISSDQPVQIVLGSNVSLLEGA